MKKPKVIQCPTCHKPVEWSEQSPSRPFCSERCRLIDLGEWANEGHSIPGEQHHPLAEDDSYY